MKTCNRHPEFDFAGFVADPRGSEWAELRDHYPTCEVCSAEVVRWSSLEAALRQAVDAGHPSEGELLGFAQHPDQLDEAGREAVRTHLDSCPVCRDGLKAATRFDLRALPAAPARRAARPSLGERLERAIEGVLDALRLPDLSPALVAAAALVLLAAPAGWIVWNSVGRQAGTGAAPAPVVVAREAGADATVPTQPRPPAEGTEVASLAPPEETSPPAEVEDAPGLQIAAAPAPEPERTSEAPPAPEPEARETIVVAARMPTASLLYEAPFGAAGAAFPEVIVRGVPGESAPPLALVPAHVGRTTRSRPRLYWFAPDRIAGRVEFSLVDPNAPDPLVEVRLPSPIAAGIHAIDLGRHGASLQPGITYEWSVSVVRDPEHRSRDAVAGGFIERVLPDAALRDALAQAGPEAGRVYAARGYWYDALAFISDWVDRRPGEKQLHTQRAELLEQVGLAPAAAWDRSAR